MDKGQLIVLKTYLLSRGKVLPQYVDQDPFHWNSRLYIARLLEEMGEIDKAYAVLKEMYEENSFRYDKDIHGDYEEYIIEKVSFFEKLAELSLKVTKNPLSSIPYLDAALIMLDGAESVYPYIDIQTINHLKEHYLAI